MVHCVPSNSLIRSTLALQEASKIQKKKGYIELATQKSGTIFTTRTLKQLSEEHNDLTSQYEKQQRSLVKEVVAIAGMCSAT